MSYFRFVSLEVTCQVSSSPRLIFFWNQVHRFFFLASFNLSKAQMKLIRIMLNQLSYISSGIIGLYGGLFLSEVIGTNHEDNKNAWIKTMMAIFEGTGM